MLYKIKTIKEIKSTNKLVDITLDQTNLFYARNETSTHHFLVHNCDIMQGGREVLREYLENKYGKESVYGVMTQGVYQIKSALQDVSRGLGLDTSLTSTLMREISNLPDIESAVNIRDYFDKLVKETALTESVYQWIEDNEKTIYWADKLLGLTKSVGTHAGGIVIAPGPIYNYIPVTRARKEVVTAFRESDGSGHDLSDLGLLKCDILGLKTLNVIRGCIDDIKKDKGIDITDTLENLDLKDPKLFEKFNKGNNVGIFQLDGNTVDHLIKTIKPDCFDDIVAINAINRPGPLETFSKVYGQWKHWEKEGNVEELEKIEKDRYPLEFMKSVLSRTYGCLLFQEEMMLMVCEAGGFNMGEADSFRRALGWRKDHPKYYTVEHLFKKLEDGMSKKGYSQSDTELFLEYCRKFMGYSFNLSHAVCYSYTGMQTLWLKTYYPEYFYAHLLNVEDHANYQNIIADAIANGIKILFPTINKARYNFKAEEKGVRIGFKALKGFGEAAQNELTEMDISKYNDIYEILALPFKKVNSAAFQCLIDTGAFDEFGIEREKIEIIRNLYKNPVIQKWFTREKGYLTLETMPECLLQINETELLNIITELKPKEESRRKGIIQQQKDYLVEELYFLYQDKITREQLEDAINVIEDLKPTTVKAIKLISIELEQYGIDKLEVINILTEGKSVILDSVNEDLLPKPWNELVTRIIPYITFKLLTEKQKDDRIEAILGFSMTLVNNLSKLISLSETFPDMNLKSLTAHESENDICYWYLIKKTTAKTKKGKDYLVLTITDGVVTVNAKCWEKINFVKDGAYISRIRKDQWGYMIIVDEILTEIEL